MKKITLRQAAGVLLMLPAMVLALAAIGEAIVDLAKINPWPCGVVLVAAILGVAGIALATGGTRGLPPADADNSWRPG